MAESATFALKAGVWFRRGRLLIVSPDSLGTACPLSGRNSTYRPVQISAAGSVSGHIEVLRLPGTHPRSLICFASGVHATLLGSCLAACARAPGRSEGAFQAGVIVQPATRLPACSHVDVSGISQVPRRSILCLCLGPRPRPNRRSLAYLSVSSMLPPLRRQRRLQRHGYIGAIAGLQHLLPTLQEWCCHHPCKAHFRLAGSPLPGGS